MSVRDEFMIEQRGRRYVLYAGLLDAAHELGLKSIETEMLLRPNPMNENLAIVKARVTMEDGRVFEGIGDASPGSVGKNIAPHVTRMAETRAKARALRDAVNIGVTAFEEIGGEEDGSSGSAGKASRASSGQSRRNSASSGGGSSGAMSEAQERYLRKLCGETGHDMPDTDGLTAREASELVKRMQESA